MQDFFGGGDENVVKVTVVNSYKRVNILKSNCRLQMDILNEIPPSSMQLSH